MSQPNLRTVMVSRIVPKPNPDMPGRTMYPREEYTSARFHCFGYELDSDTMQPYSVAIVEMPGGQIQTVMPELIRFIDKEADHG